MTVLKKRSTAALVAVIVVIFGTLFGVHRSVNAGTAKIEKLFYNGVTVTDAVTKSTYVQPSIQSQLDKRATAVLGLVSVASNYADLKELPDALRSARRALTDAVTIPDKFAANEKLQAAYVKVYAALSQQSLTDGQKTAVASYAQTLDGAQSIIDKSDYNKAVNAYIDGTLDTFPVVLLKNLAFVTYPEYFGMWR